MPAETISPAGRDRSRRGWIVLTAVLGCAVFLYAETFILPGTPRAATGDQAIYLHDAARMLDGQVMYRDFDHFTPPGTSALYLALFKLFGVRAWIPQVMLIVVGSLIAWLSFGISRKILSGPSIFLPGLVFVVLPFTGWLDATHHWYSTLAATAALAVLIEERTVVRVGVAGALWGVGSFFAQSLVLGPVGLALYLVWESHRASQSPGRLLKNSLMKKESALFGSYLATVVAFNSYFVEKAGFPHFFYNTVVFVARYYRLDPSNTWRVYLRTRPALPSLATGAPEMPALVLITLLLPLIYILFFARYGYRKSSRYSRQTNAGQDVPWERLMLVNVTGISMLLTVATAATYNRLYTVSLPALILLGWFLDSPSLTLRMLLRGLWLGVVALAIVKPVVTQTRWRGVLRLPTGQTAFFNQSSFDKTEWLLRRTKPGDYFFGDQLEVFALRLKNPGPVAFVTPTGYTRPEQVLALARGLEEHQVKFVSWYAGLDDDLGASGQDNLAPVRDDLREHYRVSAIFPNGDRIFERKP